MAEDASGARRGKRKVTARGVLIGFGLAWGPGIVVAVIVGVLTKNVGFGVLAFAVITAINAIVLGAVGSVRMKRQEERRRRANNGGSNMEPYR